MFGSSTGSQNFVWMSGYLQDMQQFLNCCDGQASGLLLFQTNSAPLFQQKWRHQYPLFHYLCKQIHADVLPFASTPVLVRGIFHLAHAVWAQEDAKLHCSELATGQPLLLTHSNVREVCGFCHPRRVPSACKVVDFSFDFKLSSQLRNFSQPAFQENEPRFDMPAIRFPKYDREHPSGHVPVATAELPMNFRTHQICL